MSIFRVFRLGIRFAAWATPHVQEWHRNRNMNRTEAHRHMEARNWLQAETHLVAALQEKHSIKVNAELLAQLSKAQLKQNKLDQAAATASAAVELARKDPASMWPALDSLASIQISQGNTIAAIQTLESMERTEKARPKPDLARLLQSARRRGTIMAGVGRHMDARAAFEESLKLAEQAHGANHVETAYMLTEVGAIYRQAGHHPQAQQHLQRALTIYRSGEDFNCPQATESLRNLALSLEESGDLSGATAQYERFVSICERQVGVSEETLLEAQVRLAKLYVREGRSSAARELLGPAIVALERNRSAGLMDALQVMVLAENQAGRPREAATYRAKAERLTAVAN
jgi:serine/threonine-protein kinase